MQWKALETYLNKIWWEKSPTPHPPPLTYTTASVAPVVEFGYVRVRVLTDEGEGGRMEEGREGWGYRGQSGLPQTLCCSNWFQISLMRMVLRGTWTLNLLLMWTSNPGKSAPVSCPWWGLNLPSWPLAGWLALWHTGELPKARVR